MDLGPGPDEVEGLGEGWTGFVCIVRDAENGMAPGPSVLALLCVLACLLACSRGVRSVVEAVVGEESMYDDSVRECSSCEEGGWMEWRISRQRLQRGRHKKDRRIQGRELEEE